MRENRTYGSEGGASRNSIGPPYPYFSIVLPGHMPARNRGAIFDCPSGSNAGTQNARTHPGPPPGYIRRLLCG